MQRGRFESLDALRGLAVLGMAWASMLPDTLPSWMYHAQEPPPDHVFNDKIFGLTWVDLVFPFFLFSMGVAIPIALSRRLESGSSALGSFLGLVGRGLTLALFAIYGEHLRAYEWSASPDASTYWTVLLGFGFLLLMFIRWPSSVSKPIGRMLTGVGWLGATLMIATHVYPDHNRGFENSRLDVILMVLANVAVSGGLVWLLTRCRFWWRLGLIAAIALIFLTSTIPNSLGKAIWDFTPMQFLGWEHWTNSRFVPVFYHFEYHKYLLMVLPGTICGDFVLRALADEEGTRVWGRRRLFAILALGISAPVLACWGLTSRDVPSTCLALVGLCLCLVLATRGPGSAMERLVMRFSRFGFGLVVLGVLAVPIGGGIRKDEPTLSYFILTAGLGCVLLAALAVVFDVAKRGRWLRLLTMTGMNPILAYVAITNLVIPLDELANFSGWLSGTWVGDYPWAEAFLSGGVQTLVVALVASAFTRKKVFLRA